MRIPLDYYRILSVPIKASSQQLEQAYGDRLLQQPRREYGEQAILARQTLIQDAYQILSGSATRAEYDARFFSNLSVADVSLSEVEKVTADLVDNPAVSPELEEIVTPESSVVESTLPSPTIEVPADKFVGALLLLQELGEYELVLELGLDFLNSPEYVELTQKQLRNIKNTTREDLILSLAIAYLELGREQWHCREYENAAASGQIGIDLLIQENLFPGVKEELETDLYKLRPYRVLEFISQNPNNSAARAKGFKLLQEMLRQRQGIEGKGQDRSGLTFDQFLCFIQQLRTYLTSAEQEQLFVTEAEYSSAIANYLGVYTLLARGLVLKQPQLIVRAWQMLEKLSELQDVSWEQSVCALLLGHTQVALDLIPKTQDKKRIDLIKHHSQGHKDLLPGMCFYGEKWLQEDVIAQFCDLAHQQISLKEYFADKTVQAYLEALPPIVLTPTESLETVAPPPVIKKTKPQGLLSRWRSKFKNSDESQPIVVNSQAQTVKSEEELVAAGVGTHYFSPATLETGGVSGFNTSSISPKPNYRSSTVDKLHKRSQQKPKLKRAAVGNHHSFKISDKKTTKASKPNINQKRNFSQSKSKYAAKVPAKRQSKSTLIKGWLFLISLVLGVGSIGFISTKLLLDSSWKTATQEEQLTISVSTPPVQLPPVKAKTPAVKPKLTFADRSRQVIKTWLDSKSAAFGKEHQIEALNQILVPPLLTTWSDRARDYQQDNAHREYQHNIKMRSAAIDENNPNLATVEAEVREIVKHYQAGQLQEAKSYDDNLLVRYQLVRKQDKWLIKNAKVLKTLE